MEPKQVVRWVCCSLCAAPLNSLPKWDYKDIFVQNKHSEKYRMLCLAVSTLKPWRTLAGTPVDAVRNKAVFVDSLEGAGAELFTLNLE